MSGEIEMTTINKSSIQYIPSLYFDKNFLFTNSYVIQVTKIPSQNTIQNNPKNNNEMNKFTLPVLCDHNIDNSVVKNNQTSINNINNNNQTSISIEIINNNNYSIVGTVYVFNNSITGYIINTINNVRNEKYITKDERGCRELLWKKRKIYKKGEKMRLENMERKIILL